MCEAMSAWLISRRLPGVGSIPDRRQRAFGDGGLKACWLSRSSADDFDRALAGARRDRTGCFHHRGEFGIGKREGRGGPDFAGFKPSRSRGLLATTSYQPLRVNPADNAEPANQMMGHQAPGLILFVFVLWDTHSFGDLPLLHPTGGSGFSDAQDELLLIFEFCFWLCHADRMS